MSGRQRERERERQRERNCEWDKSDTETDMERGRENKERSEAGAEGLKVFVREKRSDQTKRMSRCKCIWVGLGGWRAGGGGGGGGLQQLCNLPI